jgi:hypothetical protein
MSPKIIKAPKIKSIPIVKSEIRLSSISGQINESLNRVMPKSITAGLTVQQTSLDLRGGQATQSLQKQQQVQVQKPQTKQVLKTPTRLKTITTPSRTQRLSIQPPRISDTPEPIKIPIIPPIPPDGDADPVMMKDKQGYNVLIKTRQYVKGKPKGPEKFRKLTRTSLSYDDAKSLLGSALDHSIAQSGFIMPSDKPARQLTKGIPSRWEHIQHKFGKKGKRYIESRPFAIDTMGEKQELNVYQWYRQLPKQKPQKQTMPKMQMDMYMMDQVSIDFDKLMRRMRI